jgi:hypothetical protein
MRSARAFRYIKGYTGAQVDIEEFPFTNQAFF